jgi:transposase-like protein
LSEKKQYRKFTPQQKLGLLLASLRGQMSVAEICREHQISETLLRRWREQLLEAGGRAVRRQGRACRGAGSPPPDPRSRAGFGSQDL